MDRASEPSGEPWHDPGEQPAGHRVVAHTADLRVQAWAPSRAECLAEAATGLVESFADLAAASVVGVRQVGIPVAAPADQLVLLLDEVIYRMDAHSELPRAVTVRPSADGDLTAELSMVDTASVDTVGAVPKAISLYELEFTGDDDAGWTCSVTVDV